MIKNLIKLLIIFAFCQGLLYYIGIPNIIYKQIILLFTLLLFGILILIRPRINLKKYYNQNFTYLLFLNIIIFFISFLLNNSEIIPSLSYLLYYLPGFLLYFLIRKNIFNEYQIKGFNKLFFYIFIFQIFASLLKLLIVGSQEAVVGTIHYSNGSLNTIVPLIAISMISSFYLFYKKSRLYILLFLGFLFMAWTGEKRAIWFYVILILIIAYFINLRLEKVGYTRKLNSIFFRLPILVLLLFSVFYIGAKYTPTLNPEGIMGGSFSVEHIYNYASDYSNQTGLEGLGGGRLSGLVSAFNTFVSNSDTGTLLFGKGPDELVGKIYDDGSQFQYGVSSFLGISAGWSFALISTGFVGAISFALIYLTICFKCYRISLIEKDKYWKSIIIGLYLVSIVYMIDFFTYSRSAFHSIPLNICLLYFFSVIMNRYDKLIIKMN